MSAALPKMLLRSSDKGLGKAAGRLWLGAAAEPQQTEAGYNLHCIRDGFVPIHKGQCQLVPASFLLREMPQNPTFTLVLSYLGNSPLIIQCVEAFHAPTARTVH